MRARCFVQTRLLQTAMLVLVTIILPDNASSQDGAPGDIFEKRIIPIFKSPNPSSCIECHLAGVELKNYILPDSERTFRNLRDQGLIDLDAPEKSKILKLIQKGSDAKQGNAVQAGMRKMEHEAFSAWIKSCCNDTALRNSPRLEAEERSKPAVPAAVIRHARKDRLLDSFERNVWSWRFRCMNCHTEGTPQNNKNREQFGDRVAWVKRDGSAATMRYLIESKLIDIEQPDKSLLLRKPLGEKHEGGVKFEYGDQAYRGFRTWIEDVAAIRKGKYQSEADLPKKVVEPRRFGTDIWFKLVNCNAAWADKLLQVDIYSWNSAKNAWDTLPIATSDRAVYGKERLWQHNLTLLASDGSERARAWQTQKPKLPQGRYLAKVYVTPKKSADKDWQSKQSDESFIGHLDFQSKWLEGYGGMTKVDAGKLTAK